MDRASDDRNLTLAKDGAEHFHAAALAALPDIRAALQNLPTQRAGASEAADVTKHHRVLQADYSADELSGGLEWLGI